MKAQFTPGPWTVDDGGIRCDHAHNYGIVAQARDGAVYSEYTSDSATVEFETAADMHLVAAAPELYEALNNLACATTSEVASAREMAFAVLAKARGEQ